MSGTVVVVLGLLVVSNATDAGVWFGDAPGHRSSAVAIALVGLWLVDVGNNAVQGPARALLTDVAPTQLKSGNATIAVMQGIGSALGSLAGHVKWSGYVSWLNSDSCFDACGDLRGAYLLSVIVLVASIVVTVIATPEIDPNVLAEACGTAPGQRESGVAAIFRGILHMPSILRRVVVIQFLYWVGLFTYLLYITSWVGEFVAGGDPYSDDPAMRELFESGVRNGSSALSLGSIVTVLSSLFLPKIISRKGYRGTWALISFVSALCLVSTLFISSYTTAFLMMALMGLPFAAASLVPFALVALVASQEQRGLYVGLINVFIVLPQLIVSLFSGPIIHFFNDSITSSFMVGAGFALLASAVALLFLPSKKEIQELMPSKRPSLANTPRQPSYQPQPPIPNTLSKPQEQQQPTAAAVAVATLQC